MKKIYIVGRITTWPAWSIVGIYSSQKLAEEVCKDEAHFVGPAVLNEKFHNFSKKWPGAYRPKAFAKADKSKRYALRA